MIAKRGKLKYYDEHIDFTLDGTPDQQGIKAFLVIKSILAFLESLKAGNKYPEFIIP